MPVRTYGGAVFWLVLLMLTAPCQQLFDDAAVFTICGLDVTGLPDQIKQRHEIEMIAY